MFTMDFMLTMIGILLSVAFFTLMERKLMGISHYRKGPNKVMEWGLSQPMSDAMKLMTKEFTKIKSTKMIMFMTGPWISIFLMMLCWGWYNSLFNMNTSMMKIMAIMAVMSLTPYGFILVSWGSNSKYSLLGGHRVVAQIISYEVCLMIFLMTLIYVWKSFSTEMFKNMQENMWSMYFSMPLMMMWCTLCMAESNRTPFDMAEGESEIVSGFNIEYGGGMFALIFISEYGMILFMSFLTSMIFMGNSTNLMKTMLMCFLFVWVRSSFPRMRYDNLMMMSWKILLPYSICLMALSLSCK